jgi:hypothetical protein
VNTRQEASSSSSRTKLEWSPLNASRSNASYASGIFKSEKRRLYVKSSCRQNPTQKGERDRGQKLGEGKGETHLSRCSTHCQSREFSVHFHIHRLIRLYANNKFIARDILEDTTSNIIELDSNFRFLFV